MLARIALILILGAAAAGCGGGGGGDGDGEGGVVVAAFYPLAWAAQALAGPGRVASLTPAGTEPHDLELTPRDVERLRDARTVLYVGGGLMPALEDAVTSDGIEALDLLDGQELLEAPDGTPDPHVWLDPARFAGLVERMGAELGEQERAAALARRLRALDAELAGGLGSCERRTIVTSHAAFGYLADRYGLEQVSLSGVSPEAEPGPQALAALVDRVRETGATTVFFESLVSPAVAETVARETGARTAELNPLEGLTPEQEDAGADYVSVMRDNLAALRSALGCR